jgi:hypothetical protein
MREHLTYPAKNSIARARNEALEGLQQLLVLVESVPSAQLRLLMQAACLDVTSSVEELSNIGVEGVSEECESFGS